MRNRTEDYAGGMKKRKRFSWPIQPQISAVSAIGPGFFLASAPASGQNQSARA
jgi:hypothetical protein